MIYTTMRTHARLLANDPNGVVNDADVLALSQDVYGTYWESFLRDRLTLSSSFVVFAANEYIAQAATAVRDVQSLVRKVSIPQTYDGDPVLPVERDEFEAVVADTENNAADNGIVTLPRRWGMRMKNDNSKPLIAIYPATTGVTLDAYIYPLPNTLSTSSPDGDLQGDDSDGYSVARLTACEIMLRNGEDPEDIRGVFNLLDQRIQDKFQGIVARTQPRPSAVKEQ